MSAPEQPGPQVTDIRQLVGIAVHELHTEWAQDENNAPTIAQIDRISARVHAAVEAAVVEHKRWLRAAKLDLESQDVFIADLRAQLAAKIADVEHARKLAELTAASHEQKINELRTEIEIDRRIAEQKLAAKTAEVERLRDALRSYVDNHNNWQKQKELGTFNQQITASVGLDIARDKARAALAPEAAAPAKETQP